MRWRWGIVAVVLLLAGCGSAPASPVDGQASVTPSGWTSSPLVTPPIRTPVPADANAEELKGMHRLKAPERALFPPKPSEAQVIFSCAYEEGSAQWTANAMNHLNEPGAKGRGSLNAFAYDETIKLLGRGTEYVTEPWFYLQAYTRDSWPVRELVTIYSVSRKQLTKLNLAIARNEYAMGCAYDRWLDTRMVQVSVYAPWALGF
ncbi:hypothetical protein ACFV9C_23435 [Kribbella sp. NPDC059898]|uniref:hypothetical protein n=1 Tax=Kribbella sp. NPDC059898 TaxID=3346995 RepID=UPI003669A3DE